MAIDCLHYYYLFVCEAPSDVSTLRDTLSHLNLDSLKMVTFLLMNDGFINLLPDDHEYAPLRINDHRDLVFDSSVDAKACTTMIFAMLEARSFWLPAEMLSVSIDAKLYSLYNAIDDRKLTLIDLLQLGTEAVGATEASGAEEVERSARGSSYPSADNANSANEDVSDINESGESSADTRQNDAVVEMVQRLQTLRQQYVADRKTNEKFHDNARIKYFLDSLNSPVDPSLGMNSTERLTGALRLSVQHDSVLDLRECDLRGVDFQNLNFDRAKVILRADQVDDSQ